MKKDRKWLSFTALLVILVLTLFVVYKLSSPPISQEKSFEEAVRVALEIPNREIKKEELQQIESLDIRNMNVTSLRGIEYFTSLTSLKASGNSIKDLTPLSSLQHLVELDVSYNELTNISPLSGLLQLQVLNLRGNQVTNLLPLENLSELRELNIRENLVQDISVVAKLPALEDFNARYNKIKNVGALADVEHLRKRLYLNGNPIVNYSPIVKHLDEIADHDLMNIPPMFSVVGGFYDDEQLLKLSYYNRDARIFYTVDGSEPDPVNNPDNTLEYTEPIRITTRIGEENNLSAIRTANDSSTTYWKEPASEVKKGSVIRAKAILSDGTPSAIETHTYFIGMENDYSFPIISLSTNAKGFFDPKEGIYVNRNWTNSGEEWERRVNIEYFNDGKRDLSQLVGARIHGGYSRNAPQKTLRLYARDEYGTNLLYYDFFSDLSNLTHKRLLLRNSGNDFHRTMFRDALSQQLVKHLNIETQDYAPSVVFLNGEYWGIHNIRERYDTWYLENKYDVDRSLFTILQNDGVNYGVLDDGSPDAIEHYEEMFQFVLESDMSVEENYRKVEEMIDVENLIDYYIAQIYLVNTDWPANNMRYWRYNGEASEQPHLDGKWRWLLFDTDYGFGIEPGLGYAYGSSVETDMLTRVTEGDHWSRVFFAQLLKNVEFKEQFVIRYMDQVNTAFISERVIQEIENFENLYRPEMSEHIERWSIPPSIEFWNSEVQALKDFAKERPAFMKQHAKDFFSYSEPVTVQVQQDVEKGYVIINTIEINEQTPGIIDPQNWTGEYYREIPITVQAIPKQGYKFAGWENHGKEPTLTIQLTEDIVLKPIFK